MLCACKLYSSAHKQVLFWISQFMPNSDLENIGQDHQNQTNSMFTYTLDRDIWDFTLG